MNPYTRHNAQEPNSSASGQEQGREKRFCKTKPIFPPHAPAGNTETADTNSSPSGQEPAEKGVFAKRSQFSAARRSGQFSETADTDSFGVRARAGREKRFCKTKPIFRRTPQRAIRKHQTPTLRRPGKSRPRKAFLQNEANFPAHAAAGNSKTPDTNSSASGQERGREKRFYKTKPIFRPHGSAGNSENADASSSASGQKRREKHFCKTKPIFPSRAPQRAIRKQYLYALEPKPAFPAVPGQHRPDIMMRVPGV